MISLIRVLSSRRQHDFSLLDFSHHTEEFAKGEKYALEVTDQKDQKN